MLLNREIIKYLAKRVAERAVRSKAVDGKDMATIEKTVEEVINRNIQLEKEIEEEAHRLLRQHIREIEREGISYRKMLMMVKQKLAKERGLVL